jgi:hypothetical protein
MPSGNQFGVRLAIPSHREKYPITFEVSLIHLQAPARRKHTVEAANATTNRMNHFDDLSLTSLGRVGVRGSWRKRGQLHGRREVIE